MKIFNIKMPHIKRIYINFTVITLILTLLLLSDCKQDSTEQKIFSNKLTQIEYTWYDKNNNNIILNPFINNKNFKPHKEYTYYHKPIKKVKIGDSLCFRSLSTDVTLYIGDKKVLTTPFKKNVISCNSPGTVWHFYKFKDEDLNKELKLKIKTYYNDTSCYITDMYVGDSSTYILNYIHKQFFSLLIGLITLFSGFIFIMLNLYINASQKLNKYSLFHIGTFATFISIWILCSTHIFDFLPGAPQVIQFIACAILYLIPLPIIFFLASNFENIYNRLIELQIVFSLILFLLAYILHFNNIKDLHETLFLSHISIVSCCLTIIINLIKIYINSRKKHERVEKTYFIINSFLFISIIILALADVYVYYSSASSDIGKYTKFAIIFVIIYLGVIAFQNIYNLDKEITHNNFIRELAYSDGLTKLGNRTAYHEKIQEIKDDIANYSSIGIVTFDVNDLKTVNDSFGHNVGDDLIVSSANIIKNSFCTDCFCYRIGGDEFIALIISPNAKQIFKESIVAFNVNIQNFNNYNNKQYTVSIAHGHDFYTKSAKTSLDTVIKTSDKNMYNNKQAYKKSLK